MLDVSYIGVDLDDHVIRVDGRREHPILRTRILLGHVPKIYAASYRSGICREMPIVVTRAAGHLMRRRREPK
jgi:hypothetical protein